MTSSSSVGPRQRIVFLVPPTGAYCREDRCQSRFGFELIPTLRAPLEECEAAGAIKAAGGSALVIDSPAAQLSEEDVLERLTMFRPDLIVLIVTFGSLTDDLGWAKTIRDRFPGVPIGVRGAPGFTHAEEILEKAPDVTFVARGEYEAVFAEIVRTGLPAPGTLMRVGDRLVSGGPSPITEDLDLLPLPDRSVLDHGLYRVRGLGVPQATVHVQRGCPFPCSYCLVHTVSGNRSRHRSPDSVAREIAELVASGTRFFYLRAETFTIDRNWAIETSRAIARLAPDARWVTTTRVDCVDEQVLEAMSKGGCYGVSFGVDVGSKEIGRRVHKRPDLAHAKRAMRFCDRFGILSLGYFMIGFAWDTRATLEETARFCHAIRPDLLTIHFAHPYPGTQYYLDLMQDEAATGKRIRSTDAQARPAFETDALSSQDLESAANRMRVRHYSRPQVAWSIARKGIPLAIGAWLGKRMPAEQLR